MAVVVAILLALFVLPSPWGLVAIVAAAGIEIGESWLFIRFTRRRKAVTGAEGLIGLHARVVETCRPDGWVFVHGERWRAHCAAGAAQGDEVRVVEVRDLLLVVEGTS